MVLIETIFPKKLTVSNHLLTVLVKIHNVEFQTSLHNLKKKCHSKYYFRLESLKIMVFQQ